MNRTKIEWCKNPDGTQGYTWNPITGCLLRCEYCWAWKLANGRCRKACLTGHTMFETEGERLTKECLDPFYPRLHRNRLYHPWTGKPRGIFTVSMGDLFGAPDAWIENIIDLARKHESNRYYFLTKQPQNLAKWSPFPDNCWVGVSVTDTRMFIPAINWLDELEAKIKYISFEPLLERIPINGNALRIAGINWVIIGAQTKPKVMPEREWVREVVEAADLAGIPVFLKDSMRPLAEPVEWSSPWMWDKSSIYGTKLRQEMPNED